jgi:putative hemolysin
MVVNEFGGIEGIITLGDMLEALVGYLFTDVQTDTLDAMQNPDGSWILDGTLPIDECKELLRLRSWPDEESGRFQTIAGFIMDQLGHIPRPGEKLKWAGYQFEILAMDRHRIVRVLVKSNKE